MADEGSPTVGGPSFNPIFEQIACDETGEPQLIGLVAYGLYKQVKREWARQVWQEQRRPPTKAELDLYTKSWTPSRLEGLLEEAQSGSARFGSSVVEQQRQTIINEALQGSFIKSVASSITGAFFYTLLLIGFAVVLAIAGVDILAILKTLAKSS